VEAQLLNITLILLLQFFSGWAIINLFKLEAHSSIKLSLSFLMGIFVCSVVPFILALFFIPINLASVYVLFLLICVLLNIGGKAYLSELKVCLKIERNDLRSYEYIFILVIFLLVFISVWRCFYLPPTPRDVLVGAELLAKYTVEEGTMVSSVFTDNIRFSTNNPFKPPYVLNLQIVYKLLGFEFGKLWLSQSVIFFIVFLYSILRQRLHPLIVGILMILFLAIPDMYAYSFIILYDYSNAIFFTIAVYYLYKYFETRELNVFLFSTLAFGVATFIRSETLFFLFFGSLVVIMLEYRYGIVNALVKAGSLLGISFLFYSIWHLLFVKFYLPVSYEISSQLNPDLFNVNNIISIFHDINSNLIIGDSAHTHYGYFIEIFLVVTFVSFVIYRNTKAWLYLVWILILYFGFVLMVHFLPLVEIENTVKRGFFKMFPIMLISFSYNKLLINLSHRINRFET